MSVAGLDIGTSGCKCTVFNKSGRVTSSARRGYALTAGKSGGYELEPEKIWKGTCGVLKEALAGHTGSPVEALCVSSFGESFVAVDSDGAALYNIILYSDPRGGTECREWEERIGAEEITLRSGAAPHPMYSASKLMWLKNNEPHIYRRIFKVLPVAGFIIFRLSGDSVTDWSLAARTQLFNVKDKKWDDTLISSAGLKPDILCRTVIPGGVAAGVNSRAASETGLPPGTRLIAGGHDQITAALGGGALNAGQAVNGIGSVDCITPVFDGMPEPSAMASGGYAAVPYVSPNHFVTYAFNYSGGSLINWFRRELAAKTSLEQLSSEAPEKPTGLLVLPHWQGAATPHMDIHAMGAVHGLTMNITRGSLFRGFLEGCAYEMRCNLERLEAGGISVSGLTVCGGGSRSELWMQIRADILKLPLSVLEADEAGTVGSAILAGKAIEWFSSLAEGVERFVKIRRSFLPDSSNTPFYDDQFEKYRRLYAAAGKVETGI